MSKKLAFRSPPGNPPVELGVTVGVGVGVSVVVAVGVCVGVSVGVSVGVGDKVIVGVVVGVGVGETAGPEQGSELHKPNSVLVTLYPNPPASQGYEVPLYGVPPIVKYVVTVYPVSTQMLKLLFEVVAVYVWLLPLQSV